MFAFYVNTQTNVCTVYMYLWKLLCRHVTMETAVTTKFDWGEYYE